MGTNFYFLQGGLEPCPTCGHQEEPERLHIGKSSRGWCFSLHVIPDKGLNSLEDWKDLFWGVSGRIENEYGEPLSAMQMLGLITERGIDKEWGERWWDYSFLGRQSPYTSEADFHQKNGSERGPNNLLRHRISQHCIGHGEGTWDLIPGKFS